MNDFYSGTQAVAQAIITSLSLYQQEWWEDQTLGVPLFQSILGQSGTPDHIHAIDMLVQEAILGVQGVQQITSFTSSYANRTYTVNTCNVQTVYGPLDVVSTVGQKQSNGQYTLTLLPVVYQMT